MCQRKTRSLNRFKGTKLLRVLWGARLSTSVRSFSKDLLWTRSIPGLSQTLAMKLSAVSVYSSARPLCQTHPQCYSAEITGQLKHTLLLPFNPLFLSC